MSGEVLAQIERGELDVGFYLGHCAGVTLSPSRLAARKVAGGSARARAALEATGLEPFLDARFSVRELMHFTYRVLAPAGWGPQVLGKDWKALASLPWIATPPASAHHRLLTSVFGPLGVEPPPRPRWSIRRRRCWTWSSRAWD